MAITGEREPQKSFQPESLTTARTPQEILNAWGKLLLAEVYAEMRESRISASRADSILNRTEERARQEFDAALSPDARKALERTILPSGPQNLETGTTESGKRMAVLRFNPDDPDSLLTDAEKGEVRQVLDLLTPRLDVDKGVNAGYLTLQNRGVDHVKEVNPGITVDYDDKNEAIGVEIQFSALGYKLRENNSSMQHNTEE